MFSEASLGLVLHDAVSRAKARAVAAGLSFEAQLGAPASDDGIASLERRLDLNAPAELRDLLSLHDGVVAATFGAAHPLGGRVTLRVYSCAQIIEQTEYLKKFGYISNGLCAVGAWDGMSARFVAAASGPHGIAPGGVLDTSPDDPTSFEGPADYPDIRSWLTAVLAEL